MIASLTPSRRKALLKQHLKWNLKKVPNGRVKGSTQQKSSSEISRSIAVQTDGKMLVGGDFTMLSPNSAAPLARNRIARLNLR